MNLKIITIDTYLFLQYRPDYPNFLEELKRHSKNPLRKSINLRNTFLVDYSLYKKSKALLTRIDKDNTYTESDDEFLFLIGSLENNFFKMDANVLGLFFDLYFEKTIKFNISYFIKSGIGWGYSIFKGFNEIYNGRSLYITNGNTSDGSLNNTLSLAQLKACAGLIPTTTEIRKYRQSRYTQALINYLDVKDKETEFAQYLKKKINKQVSTKNVVDDQFVEFDILKYKTYLGHLKEMLKNPNVYNENDWQIQILKIFKLLNPKYIYVGEKIPLTSFVTQKSIYPDIVLVDNDGNIDLIEIKRPEHDIFYACEYRKNYVPLRELQGTCMQLQNYLISLIKTPTDILQNKKFKEKTEIPIDMKLKAISPKGYIIYGRDTQLQSNEKMLTDFQIIRNMYANVIDIITYDDLIRRLENMLKALVSTT